MLLFYWNGSPKLPTHKVPCSNEQAVPSPAPPKLVNSNELRDTRNTRLGTYALVIVYMQGCNSHTICSVHLFEITMMNMV